MKHFLRDDVQRDALPGRVRQVALGRVAHARSENMTIGFARISADAGPMEAHAHGEEGIYVLAAKDGWVKWGPEEDQLTERLDLAAGMVLQAPAGEWHLFGCEDGGFIDTLFVFAPPM
jgi:quercetin dioxygenase-like cupin family protein